MELEILKTIADISGIGVAGVLALCLLIQIRKKGIKNFFNGSNTVQLDRIEKNHLEHIETVGKRAVALLEKMDDKLDKTIMMNQRIFDKLNK